MQLYRNGNFPLQLAKVFKDSFIEGIDKIVRAFQNCYKSEDIFSITETSTVEQIVPFTKKKCPNETFYMKTFHQEKLEKLAEYYCDFFFYLFFQV